MAGFLVAKVQGFSTRLAYRIVVPWGEAKQVGVLAPGIAKTAFRDDSAKARIRNYIDPGRRGCVARRGCDDVFATVKRESSRAVEEDQIIPGRFGLRGRLGTIGAGRCMLRDSHLGRHASVDLVGQRAAAVGNDCAGDRMKKNPVLGRYLLCVTNKNAPGTIDH